MDANVQRVYRLLAAREHPNWVGRTAASWVGRDPDKTDSMTARCSVPVVFNTD
ncbi:hypothetical protein AArc1_2951 [Natrarchaeobaculum sulfurireducens]|uniref:Uncharacterized protein n=1 Tax=Natrarchaeobaculum sulfurireducens TaxID=2044521 RepID=A0A346PIB4_9EURY|nr:hypothetical protein AArc1_2951 [Natrarchaeobaculum sulfurireducens]